MLNTTLPVMIFGGVFAGSMFVGARSIAPREMLVNPAEQCSALRDED
jgi:hypothetical protein